MPTNGQEQSSGTMTQVLAGMTLACGAVCAIPPTSMVGAILWIGYLGDMLASHIGSSLLISALIGCYLGLILLVGLWLRDRKSRAWTLLRR
jgi:hypothetical protein